MSTPVIYNVTIKVEHSIAREWLEWLKNEHVPGMIATGCFTSATILHLLESHDNEGNTYAVQYHAASKEKYNEYINRFSVEMRQKGLEKWGDRFIAFRTVMQVVN